MTELTKSDPNPQYLSLAQLTQQLGRYEATPVPIQGCRPSPDCWIHDHRCGVGLGGGANHFNCGGCF